MRGFALMLLMTAAFMNGCGRESEQTKPSEPSLPVSYPKDEVSDAHRDAITKITDGYMSLAWALSKDDLEGAKESAGEILESLKKASKLEALNRAEWELQQYCFNAPSPYLFNKQIQDSNDIKTTRRWFNLLSIYIIKMTREFGHNLSENPVVCYCRMAFNDRGAYWLQRNQNVPIRNPYFGKEMLECGEKKELLAGRPK